jgi:hypothetical protein
MNKDYSKRTDKNLLEKVDIIVKEQVRSLKKETPIPLEVEFYPREKIPIDLLAHYVDVKQELEKRRTGKKTKTNVFLPTKATIAANVKTLVKFHNPWLLKEIEKRNLDILSKLHLN